ncbi:MAG TPA: DUF1996 domain-containing protein, partial [Gaiellales bacterium]|nr:DUF1996 domain-containing protein [Gaiellales bacterium]
MFLRPMAIALVALAVSAAPAEAARAAAATAVPTSMAGRFSVVCPYSNTRAVDPIMAFGQRPSPHLHDFFGNIAVHARSTRKQLRDSPTTCQDPADTSGYWEPAPIFKGYRVHAVKL